MVIGRNELYSMNGERSRSSERRRSAARDNRKFCNAHGGRRIYGELLALLDDCERMLTTGDRAGSAGDATLPGDASPQTKDG
jgi:hypothetical protein